MRAGGVACDDEHLVLDGASLQQRAPRRDARSRPSGRDDEHLGARVDLLAVQLGKTQVVARRQTNLDVAVGRSRTTPRIVGDTRGGGVVHLAGDAHVAVEVDPRQFGAHRPFALRRFDAGLRVRRVADGAVVDCYFGGHGATGPVTQRQVEDDDLLAGFQQFGFAVAEAESVDLAVGADEVAVTVEHQRGVPQPAPLGALLAGLLDDRAGVHECADVRRGF